MVWGPAQFERDACEESVCRGQLLNQQLYWQKPGVQRKYLSWRHKIGDLSAYKWHLKPWEGERDVRKEEKPALRMPTFRETSCPQRETARREQAARAANVGDHREESVLVAHRWSEQVGPAFQHRHNEEVVVGAAEGERRGGAITGRAPAQQRKGNLRQKGRHWERGKACPGTVLLTSRAKPAHAGLSSAGWLGRGPVSSLPWP